MVVVMLASLRVGSTLVVMSKFELEPFLKCVQKYRLTRLHLVPPIVSQLAKYTSLVIYYTFILYA